MSASNAARPDAVEVAVVTVNYRTADLTKNCIASLRAERARLPRLRAVIVDGASGDGSAEDLAEFVARPEYRDWVSLLPLTVNGGFGWANNQAILTLARGETPPDFIHILNPDAEVAEGAVTALVSELRRNPRCGAAGSQLLSSEGDPTASAFRFPTAGRELISAAQSEKLGRLLGIAPVVVTSDAGTDVDWVTGASVLLRSEALRDVGLFDDGFFLYFDEVELLHRLRACGWTVRYVPESRVIHLEGVATGLGGNAGQRPLPAYWYHSRRRYFGLTGGRAATLGANLAWLAGRVAGLAKRVFGGSSRQPGGIRIADLARLGFWPRSQDLRPSVPAWGDPPGKPPAWKSWT